MTQQNYKGMHTDKHYTAQVKTTADVNQTAMEMYKDTTAIGSRETSRPTLLGTGLNGRGK